MHKVTLAQLTPLYATCPHCDAILQCFTNHAKETKLPEHMGSVGRAKTLSCKGSGEVAISPRTTR